MKTGLTGMRARLREFLRDRKANVAMMFGIALVPITIAAGVGLDYAREAQTKSQISDALDAASLAVGATQGLTTDQVAAVAKQYFEANYKGSGKMPTLDTPVYDKNGSVTLSVTDYSMDTAVLKAVGISTMKVSASSTVVWGQSKLWVALVLDNSLSMNQSGKMTSLKSAATDLLSTLQKAASKDGDVLVGIVPFTNTVLVDTTSIKSSSTYLDWTNWSAQGNADVPDSTYGPGDDCPYSYGCRKPGSATATVSSIPNSGGTKGYICPWASSSSSNISGTNSHYYMGCFTSTATGTTKQIASGSNASCGSYASANCSCSGSGSSKKCSTKTWNHSWAAETDKTLWAGCITDRTQDYDIKNTQPSGSTSGFPADNNDLCPSSPIMPLSYSWSTMKTAITNMNATGSTNQAIGVAHGWQMLTPGAPYGTAAVPSGTSRFLILLSDGLNTQDRWYGNGMTESTTTDAKIDARQVKADSTKANGVCDNAKADGIIIYTLFLNTNSTDDSAPLKNCATDSSKYFKVTASADLAAAFATIGQQITSVRVSK